MTSNPPEQVTAPPEGYEWHEDGVRVPRGEPWAVWTGNRWEARTDSEIYVLDPRPILRRVKPETVAVELPRHFVEEMASREWMRLPGNPPGEGETLTNACHAALEKEANSDQ